MRCRCLFPVMMVALVYASCCLPDVRAQRGTLASPFPSSATNGALHYQRALLQLAELDLSQTELLSQPVWEALPTPVAKTLPNEIANLVYRGRYAIRSASKGTRCTTCDFGIDFRDVGASGQLPHVDRMLELGRLLTLRGAAAEAAGQWEEAAIIYFDGLRMGKHLAAQNTLLEAIAGMKILRNNYYALASWATRCPSRSLIARAFGLLESMQGSLVDPPAVLAREASLLASSFDRLMASFPNGNWAAVILESEGLAETGDREKDEERAMAACISVGVPQAIFRSAEAFQKFVLQFRGTSDRFVEAAAACMALPPQARLARAADLDRKYSELMTVLGGDTLVDAETTGALFAEHEAELVVTRLALAVSASKSEDGYPKSLEEVAARFGGRIPANPYTDQPVEYAAGDGGKTFGLSIAGLGRLPAVSFESSPPSSVTVAADDSN